MTYKVTLKNGKAYRASKVDHAPGFVTFFCWQGEIRVPMGEVIEIHSTEWHDRRVWLSVLGLLFVVTLVIGLLIF